MSDHDRYHRQAILPQIGHEGQNRLGRARVLIVGCGALGTALADSLARAGIAFLRIIDRDIVELTNLQRQVLFDEADVRNCLPKAEAARQKLMRINSEVEIDAVVDDFNAANAARYVEGIDLILDGLDNFETRYLLNDLAVRHGLPYIYGGVIGTTGMSMTIVPESREYVRPRSQVGINATHASMPRRSDDSRTTPCLRCIFPEPPPPGSTPTCDTAGVLHAAVATVAARQVVEAIRLIVAGMNQGATSDERGKQSEYSTQRCELWSVDVWTGTTRIMDVSEARRDDCPCCVQRTFEHLKGGSRTTSLCGRNAVQIVPACPRPDNGEAGIGDGPLPSVDLDSLYVRLRAVGDFQRTEHCIRGTIRDGRALFELTVFPNGRAMVAGTDRPEVARGVYAKYIGL